MNGTATKEADPLYQGILNYYANLSGLNITAEQIAIRDGFKKDNGIVCDNSLDSQVMSIQASFVAEDNPTKKKTIIEEAIALLGRQ